MRLLSTFVKRRWGNWGILIFMLWALILAMLAIANLLLLSQAVELYSDEAGNQSRVWLIFGLNVCFGLGFGLSAYGLWERRNWGRVLFLWCLVIWSGFNLAALFLPRLLFASVRDYSAGGLAANSIRFAVGLLVSLWYLNLPRIKTLFDPSSSANFATGEVTTDDNPN